MSRPLGSILVLLALWMQILAPAAAARMTLAAENPLGGLTICGHSVDGTADPDQRQSAPVPLCGFCCTPVAVLGALPPDMDGVTFTWTALAFGLMPDMLAASIRRQVPRARDPPVLA